MPKGYDPSRYPNPALQWHYRILQAYALEDELPEFPEDFTLPKYKSIHNRVGKGVIDLSRTTDRILKEI
jgi:ATP-dependent DNA helicase 2 subunit 1